MRPSGQSGSGARLLLKCSLGVLNGVDASARGFRVRLADAWMLTLLVVSVG